MESKHTPGAWAVHQAHSLGHGAPVNEYTITGSTGTIAITPARANRDNEANASLIAAAPELLNAVEYLLTIIDRSAPELQGMMEYDYARSAIAKATGA